MVQKNTGTGTNNNLFLNDELIELFEQGNTTTKYELTIQDNQYVLKTTIEQRVNIGDMSQDAHKPNESVPYSVIDEQKTTLPIVVSKSKKKKNNSNEVNKNGKITDSNVSSNKKNAANTQNSKANNTKATNKNVKNNNLNCNELKRNEITGADINNINLFYTGDNDNKTTSNNWQYNFKNNDGNSKTINNKNFNDIIKDSNNYKHITNSQPEFYNNYTDNNLLGSQFESVKKTKIDKCSESLIDLLKNKDEIDIIRITRRLSEGKINMKKKIAVPCFIPTKEKVLQDQIDSLQNCMRMNIQKALKTVTS